MCWSAKTTTVPLCSASNSKAANWFPGRHPPKPQRERENAMAGAYVTLDGYVVRKTTELAVGVRKADNAFAALTWLPRSACTDGDTLDLGDEDIDCRESLAEEKGLE